MFWLIYDFNIPPFSKEIEDEIIQTDKTCTFVELFMSRFKSGYRCKRKAGLFTI